MLKSAKSGKRRRDDFALWLLPFSFSLSFHRDLMRSIGTGTRTTPILEVSPPRKNPLLQGGPGSVRFGYGLEMERFKRFRFSVPVRFLCKKGFSVFQYSLTGKDGSGSDFGSWKTVPAVPVPLSQWARRDRLMSRGKNCRETIFVSHLSRNYPHRGVSFERG